MNKKSRHPTDRDFQELAISINNAIKGNEGLIGDQEEQVKLLFSLENKFKHHIQRYQQTANIYVKFVKFITQENCNILSARPYFREKGDVFSKKITPAIKGTLASEPTEINELFGKTAIKSLMSFSVNFQLINFIVKNWKGKLPDVPKRYYEEFLEARRILIENNLPLAINRAKKFYRKTPRSHLTLLDLIDICTYGLISGIDKYVGVYNKGQWVNVCIGRMVGYMIEDYSKTFLRMYPSDKKILYRANSLKFRLKIENVEELTKAVNESFEKDKEEGKKIPKLPISEVHVRTLLNGSSYISADSKSGDDEDGVTIYDYTPDEKENAEEQIIKKDLMSKILIASKDLNIIERKIIKLKGVDL